MKKKFELRLYEDDFKNSLIIEVSKLTEVKYLIKIINFLEQINEQEF